MRRILLAGAGALALGAGLPTSAQAAVVLTDGRGRVEVLPESGGRGQGVLPGEPLGSGTLAVGEGSKAVLATDDGATLTLDGAAKAIVQGGASTTVALEKGKLSASGGSRAVEVKAANGLVASATGARFDLALSADGAMDIDDEQGALSLSMGDAKVQLAAGQKLHLAKGQPLYGPGSPSLAKAEEKAAKAEEKAAKAEEKPAKEEAKAEKPSKDEKAVAVAAAEKPAEKPGPSKAEGAADKPAVAPAPAAPAGPPSLSVKWPTTAIFTSFTLRGQTTPGAKVLINDVAATVRKNGSFSAKITLPEGESTVQVKATGADGQEASDSHAVKAIKPPEAAPAGDAAPSDAAKPAVKQEGAGWE